LFELNLRIEGFPNKSLVDFFLSRVKPKKNKYEILITNNENDVEENGVVILTLEDTAIIYDNSVEIARIKLDVNTIPFIWALGIERTLKKGFDELFYDKLASRKMVSKILQSLVVLMEVEDEDGFSHSQRVTNLLLDLAKELKYPRKKLEYLREFGMLHDVGKIGIEQLMLYSPTRIRVFENTGEDHTILGSVYLATIPVLADLAPLVRSHHERWDGKGFPDGLKGEEIPYESRMLAVCDWYDIATNFVMTEIYNDVMEPEIALKYIQTDRAFDPKIAKAFVEMMKKRI